MLLSFTAEYNLHSHYVYVHYLPILKILLSPIIAHKFQDIGGVNISNTMIHEYTYFHDLSYMLG